MIAKTLVVTYIKLKKKLIKNTVSNIDTGLQNLLIYFNILLSVISQVCRDHLINIDLVCVADDVECVSDGLSYNLTLSKHHSTKLASTERGQRKSNLTAYYYSTITEKQLYKLYEIYKLDFLLFNYSISPYDQYVRKN